MSAQLTLDGREVEVGRVFAGKQNGRTLTAAQTLIVRSITVNGFIRSTQAGVLMHMARGHCGFGAKNHHRTLRVVANKIGCCEYASTDGLMALRRLQDRGLVRRTFLRGRWILV